MRTLKDFLQKNKKNPHFISKVELQLDEKTVFFVAKKVLVTEYGVRGGENIIPTLKQLSILWYIIVTEYFYQTM